MGRESRHWHHHGGSCEPRQFCVQRQHGADCYGARPSGTASPTGSVFFVVGQTLLGSGVLSSGSGGSATANLTVNGSQLSNGSNSIAASYARKPGVSSVLRLRNSQRQAALVLQLLVEFQFGRSWNWRGERIGERARLYRLCVDR